MRTIALILSVLALIWAAPQEMTSGDLDAVIAEIFGKPKETTASIPLTPGKSSTIVPPVSPKSDDGPKRKCMTEDGESGECVHYYLCNSNNSIITDGVGVIDIRVQDDKCPSYMDVCCVLRDTRNPTDPITPAPDKLPQHEGCGWRNPDGAGFRITGDKDGESKFGEFPWMVAILKILSCNECRMTSCSNTSASKLMDQNIHSFTSYNIKMGLNCMSHIKIEPVNEDDPNGQSLNVYVGGGSLIHLGVVLTAAHYVAVSKTLRVRAGEWDTQTTKEIYPYQDRDVSSVVVHKDFNKGNLFYDIALLFLQTPMEMAPNVGVVCLPPPGVRVPGGTQCLASGWGKDKFGKEGRYQVILKKVQVPVVERRQCQNLLRKTRLGNFFELHTSFMCAGGENGVDTCKGDGGSPLVCPVEFERDRYMQSGIVAWGIGCGENGVPGVYVDVSNLRTWIDDKIKGKGLDTKVYSF